jgi:hypothetical protein
LSSTVTASARLFTAANSEYFSAADATWNSPTGPWYQAGWVYLNSTATQIVGFCKYDNVSDNAFQPYYSNVTGKFGLDQSGDGLVANLKTVTFGTGSTTGTWYFVEFYYDGSVIGVNVNRGTDVTTAQTAQFNSSLEVRLGRNHFAPAPFYANCRLQSFAFYNGTMPSSTVRDSLYNSGNGKLYKDLTAADKVGLEAWYDGAETSGMLLDASGNAHHLTDNNTVTSAAGKVTYTAEDASQFTAANNEYLSITNAAQTGLNIGDTDYWFGAWIRLDNTGTLRQVISKWLVSATSQNSYTLYISAANIPIFIVTPTGATADTVTATSTLPAMVANTWYFVEGWHDSVNNLIGVTYNRGTANTTAHSTGVFIGNRDFTISTAGSPDLPFNGRIQEVVAVSGIPTSSERDAIFGRGFGVDVSDRPTLSAATYVSWWKLSEASGNRADSIGTNTLTDNNTVTGNPGVVYDAVTPPPASGNYGSTLGFSGIIQ